MKDLKEFDISFIGLKEGKHRFEYRIEKAFFDFFEYEEFFNSDVVVDLCFHKKASLFELSFAFDGWTEVACDVSNELFHQQVDATLDLVVKFGDSFNDENEEILVIPHGEFKINVAQYIYEAIVLSMPLKKIHPGLNDGSLKTDVLKKLKEFEPTDIEDKNSNSEIDPRWEKLKEILTDKNIDNGTS